ncbi:MAG: hypothetical protein R3B13_05630 [Polyangiaceae bacterium]
MSYMTKLLGDPASVIDSCLQADERKGIAARSLVFIVLGGGVFGAAVGAQRGGLQIGIAALKIPLATLLALAVAGPALHAIAQSFGRRWSLSAALALLLSAGARASLVLLALAPVLWLSSDLGLGYSPLRLAAAASYALAGMSAGALLSRAVGPAPGRRASLLLGAVVSAVIAAQSAWVLRPYIGDPRDTHAPLLAHGRLEGGVLGALADDLGAR